MAENTFWAEVPGCGFEGTDVMGTGIMSVPGKVAPVVGGWSGALSNWSMSSADNWVIGSLLADADICSIESILSPVEDCWMVSM